MVLCGPKWCEVEEISGPTGQNWSEISYMDLFLRSSRWVIFLGHSVQSNIFRKHIVNRKHHDFSGIGDLPQKIGESNYSKVRQNLIYL